MTKRKGITGYTSDKPRTPTTKRKMTGLFDKLTPAQQEAALSYRGPENHGQPMDDVPEFDVELEEAFREEVRRQASLDKMYLYDADPACKHHVVTLWSGVKCTKCHGWYCA